MGELKCTKWTLAMRYTMLPSIFWLFRFALMCINYFRIFPKLSSSLQYNLDLPIDKNAHIGSSWYHPRLTQNEASLLIQLEQSGTFVCDYEDFGDTFYDA